MKKNKGFTLIELLSVVVVVAIILVVAIPNIMKIIDKAKMDSYNKTVDAIVRAAEIYAANHRNTIAGLNNTGDIVNISLQNLIDDKLIDNKIYDNINKKDIDPNSIILISLDSNNEYNYKFVNTYNSSDYVVDSSLKVWLDGYDAPVGNLWKDKSGNNYNGTMTSMAGTSTSGYNSTLKAYAFDGVNDNISIPYGNGINPNNYTISLVANTNIITTSQSFIATYNTVTPIAQRLYIANYYNTSNYSSTYNMGIQDQSWAYGIPIQNGVAPASSTSKVAITVQFENGQAKIYINNQYKFYRPYTAYSTASNFSLGYLPGGGYYLNGNIYSVKIYNRLLSSSELLANYLIDKQRFNIQ
jgi:type IV pilus assembly protein PilA